MRHEAVAAHMVESCLRARSADTAADALARMAVEKPACTELALLTDGDRLRGVVPLARLVSASPEESLEKLLDPAFPRAGLHDDQERAASIALHHRVDALPQREAGRVPALVYMADAIGTQTETVAVRGLSLTRAGLAPLLAGELRTGILIGLVLGAIAFPSVLAAFGDARLAAAVGISIFVAGTAANGIGLLLPALLDRLGFDPAYGSGPASTVLSDICTVLVYIGVVRALAL